MHNPRILLTLLLSIIFLSGSAGAIEEIKQENIYSFDISAPDGLYLSGVTVEDIMPSGTFECSTANNTFIFNQYGDIYTLYINTTKHYDARWNFGISMVYPNGSISQTELTSLNPFASNFDIHIQYYALEIDSPMDVDIYLGLAPLTATIPHIISLDMEQVYDYDLNLSALSTLELSQILAANYGFDMLAFSEISGTSSVPVTVTIYASNEEEFADQSAGNLNSALNDAVGDLFSWTWDNILSFVELIPGVGSYLALTLEMSAIIIDSVIFYFNLFFIEFAETTFISAEAIIWTYSISGFKRGGFWGFMNKTITTHGALIEFGFNILISSITAFFRILEGIAAMVDAMKPT